LTTREFLYNVNRLKKLKEAALMLRKILIITVLMLMMAHGNAFAEGGDNVMIDMLYGAGIGAMLGAAIYVFDENDLTDKVIKGAALGTIGGFVYGMVEVTSVVELQRGDIKLAAPVILLEEGESGLTYRTSLFKYSY
jgi:hypothetical protein